jgi:hypothetical protein
VVLHLHCLGCEPISPCARFVWSINSSFSSSGGMIAPLLGGSLLMINNSYPVYASIVIFLLAAVAVLFLRGHEGKRADGGLMH